MRFSSLTFLLVAAGTSFGLAAPAEAGTDNTASTNSAQWTCDNGWDVCGVCNGSSCKIAGIQNEWVAQVYPIYNYNVSLLMNYSSACEEGSCAGPEGGDGKHCGYKNGGPRQCPGF
ncbi:unnamed protein product [Penicillium pancosmium]